jgi:hypothetical protein
MPCSAARAWIASVISLGDVGWQLTERPGGEAGHNFRASPRTPGRLVAFSDAVIVDAALVSVCDGCNNRG